MAQVNPTQKETHPNRVETHLNLVETHLNCVETHPNRVETHPNRVETHLNRVEVVARLEVFLVVFLIQEFQTAQQAVELPRRNLHIYKAIFQFFAHQYNLGTWGIYFLSEITGVNLRNNVCTGTSVRVAWIIVG
jgi:hypothetical protein